MVVTASVDRTARVWSPLKSTAEALVIIDKRGAGGGGAVGSGSAGQFIGSDPAGRPPLGKGIDDKNAMFHDEVKHAQFFHMDRFLTVVVGGRILLYEVKLAIDAADDLERLRKKHRFREVASFQSRAGVSAYLYTSFMHSLGFVRVDSSELWAFRTSRRQEQMPVY